MQSRRRYSDEFKQDAIRLLETSGKPISAIERELGISHGLLRKWRKRFQVNPVNEQFEVSEVEQLQAQVRALKRELDSTRMERDILKKTVGIFSQENQR